MPRSIPFSVRRAWCRAVAALAVLGAVVAAPTDALAQSTAPAPAAQNQPETTAGSASIDPAQRAATEKIIRDYLLANPEVVIDAIRIYREQVERHQEEMARAALAHRRAALVSDPGSPVGGNPDGDVTIVEFFDYRCGYCKRVLPTIKEALKTDKNLRIVFKEFPILGDQSVFAARAALAVHKLDPKKYEPFHNALMASTGNVSESRVMRLAGELGLDPEAVRKTMDSPEIDARIDSNHQLAQSLNIRGTPAFVIGNELVPGLISLEQLRQLVAQARNG